MLDLWALDEGWRGKVSGATMPTIERPGSEYQAKELCHPHRATHIAALGFTECQSCRYPSFLQLLPILRSLQHHLE